jgi:GH24 family phage-related lysozyme (muramidase)
MTIPKSAIDLIVNEEGLDQPSKWPGGGSGITIGIGYDIGEERNFKQDWAGVMPADQILALSKAIGITGQRAHEMAINFRSITISMEQALKVFATKTLPHYIDETLKAFPGIEKLPDVVLGAMVSIVYNRGADTAGPRRVEMREIRNLISAFSGSSGSDAMLQSCLKAIATQIRMMKRLWVGTDIEHDMNGRRESEAKLVETALE